MMMISIQKGKHNALGGCLDGTVLANFNFQSEGNHQSFLNENGISIVHSEQDMSLGLMKY